MFRNLLFAALFITPLLGAAQTFNNPINSSSKIFNSQDLFIMNDKVNVPWHATMQVMSYNFQAYLQGDENPFENNTGVVTVDIDNSSAGRRLISTAANLDGDRDDEIICLREEGSYWDLYVADYTVSFDEENQQLNHVLLDPTGFVYESNGNTGDNPIKNYPRLMGADVDGDGTDEVVLSWRNATTQTIQTRIYDGNGTASLSPAGLITDLPSIGAGLSNPDVYNIGHADLDNDGAEEILIIGIEQNTGGNDNPQIFIQVYDVPEQGSSVITPMAHYVLDNNLDDNYGIDTEFIGVGVAGVEQFDGDGNPLADKVVASFTFNYAEILQDLINNHFTFLLSPSVDMMDFQQLGVDIGQNSFLGNQQFNVKEANIDGMSSTEVLVQYGSQTKVFTAEGGTLNMANHHASVGLSTTTNQGMNLMDLGDIDADGKDELVLYDMIFNGTDFVFYTKVYGVVADFVEGNDNSQYHLVEQTVQSWTENGNGDSDRMIGICVGNFDGSDVRLGEGTSKACEYLQPVLNLAGIPLHYDYIDGMGYDLATCFDGSICSFKSSYLDEGTEIAESGTTVHSDWAVSSTVEGGFNYGGLSVNASLTANYGEEFSNTETETISSTISVEMIAISDDLVVSHRYPMEVWEYPVLDAADDTVSWVIAAFPEENGTGIMQVQPSKSTYNDLPNHEVGNVLSYPDFVDYTEFPDYPAEFSWENGNPVIFDDVLTWTMSSGAALNQSISFSESYENSQSESWTGGLAPTASASGYGFGVSVSGNYNQGELRVNSQTVSNTKKFSFNAGQLIQPSGEYDYQITPRIYWNRDGSGVVDFKVSIDDDANSGSFWVDNYLEKADPAMIMPWRNDQHHSELDPNDPKIDRCKSMRFSNLTPTIGEHVTVELRVMNYSLKATDEAVEVEFYLGHPSEGNIISDINGYDLFSTSAALSARGREIINMTFAANEEFIQNTGVKIYAVLDPNENMDEVHEDNNIAWSLLGYDCNDPGSTPTNIDEMPLEELQANLLVYPNPGESIVNVEFSLPQSATVKVNLLDASGRVVREMADRRLQQSHYKLTSNIESLAPGLYFVRMTMNNKTVTQKLQKL